MRMTQLAKMYYIILNLTPFQFVILGGSMNTMLEFAKFARAELYLPAERLDNLCRSERYGLWKVGPVLVVAVGPML